VTQLKQIFISGVWSEATYVQIRLAQWFLCGMWLTRLTNWLARCWLSE